MRSKKIKVGQWFINIKGRVGCIGPNAIAIAKGENWNDYPLCNLLFICKLSKLIYGLK